MPSLAYLTFTARERTPTAKVSITHAGSIYDVSSNVSRDAGAITITGRQFGRPYAGATVKMVGPLPFTPLIKDIIQINIGYNGQVRPRFIGVITNPGTLSYPSSWTIQASDILWMADFAVQESGPASARIGGIVLDGPGGTANFVPANDAIVRLLRDWAGIPAFRILLPELVTAPGEPWVLGTLSPVAWSGVSPLQACLEIADVLGYWLFCDESGYIRMRLLSGHPPDEVDFVLEEGVNVLTKAPSSVSRDSSGIYNQVVVTGATTLIVDGVALPVTDARQADLFDLLPHGKYRQLSYTNHLIEYVTRDQAGEASCEAVAERLLAEHSRPPATIQGTIKGNPFLQVGQSIGYKGDRLGYTEQRTFFLYAYSETFGGGVYEQTITLDGGLGDVGYTTIPPPTAAFTTRLMYEFLEGEGAVVEVFCDAAPSISSLGAQAITGYTWSAPGGTPAVGTGRQWMTRVPATATSIAITLTVTDATGKTSLPVTRTVPLATGGELPARRILNFAGDTWYVTPDGGETWNTAPVAAEAVPPISAGGDAAGARDDVNGLLATGGTLSETLRRTLDHLATAPTTLVDTGHTIRFIWQHEKVSSRIWIAIGAAVYLSVNGGTSFSGAKTPPNGETIHWVVESADTIGVIDVLAGSNVYTSFDGHTDAPHWITSLEGPAGSTALCYTSGHAKHWVGLSVASGSPLRNFEGDAVTFPVLVPPVLEIRACTLLVDQPVLYAFDAQGRIWRINADDGSDATHVADVPSTPNHAVRDGDVRLIYIAADDGLYKYLIDAGEVVMMKAVGEGERGWMVGYAGMARIDPDVPPPDPPDMFPPLLATSTAGSIRGISLEDVAEPPGWETTAFDDTAWPFCQRPQYGGITPLPGAQPQAARSYYQFDKPEAGEENLIRQHVTLPAGTIVRATFECVANDNLLEAYLNGAVIAGAVTSNGSTVLVDVDPTALVTGANVLALRISNAGGPTDYYMWGSWRLLINGASTGSGGGDGNGSVGTDP